MFYIEDGREHFYQWDTDRKLVVNDTSITEVHFCNRTDNCSLVVEVQEENGARVVNVPNILLQSDWKIRVYAWDGSHTKHDGCFEVASRTKPADYVYTETEVLNYSTLLERIEELEEKCVEIVNLTYDEIDKVFPEYAFYQASSVEDETVYEKAPFLVGMIETITDNGGYFVAPTQYQIGISHDDGSVYTRKITYNISGINFTAWERHSGGSIDLSEYVKKTDYATANEAGVAKIGNGYGLIMTDSGEARVYGANKEAIDARASYNAPITPNNLEYAVKSVGDDYYVKNTDYADNSAKYGLVKVAYGYGTQISSDGYLAIVRCSKSEIDAKTNSTHPITPDVLDYAVKSVGDGYYATEAQVGDIETALDAIIAIQESYIGG